MLCLRHGFTRDEIRRDRNESRGLSGKMMTNRQGHSIAIIDDSASVRRSIGSLLRSLGFVVTVFDSADAFMASQVDVCCIVTDVEMPGMTGVDLYEALRARKDETPIIFITSVAKEHVRYRLGDEPCVLTKPFEADELADCIRQVISTS